MKSTTGQYYLGLDQIRALAALMVLSWHFTHAGNPGVSPFHGAGLFFPFSVLDEGHTGVSLFMTLSGYLFAKLLDGKDIHYPSFLWNRFIRLAPLLGLVCLADLIVELHAGRHIGSILKGFAMGAVLPTLPHGGWSITTEVHFYFLLPLLLLIFRRSRWFILPALACTITLRALLYLHYGQMETLSYWTIFGRIDQFMLGVAAFQFASDLKGRHYAASAVALAFTAFYWIFDMSGGYSGGGHYPSHDPIWIALPAIEGIAYAVLIAYYDQTFRPKATGVSQFVATAGAYSYSIYLLHGFVAVPAARFIDRHIMSLHNWYVAQAWAVLMFLAMVPIGWLSFKFIEEPFLRYRVRYVRTPKAGPGVLIAA